MQKREATELVVYAYSFAIAGGLFLFAAIVEWAFPEP